jgi:hypothetical protein
MRTAAFRNREAIVEATEEDLVRDVRMEMDKAQGKLTRIRERLETVTAEAEFLSEAEIKLSAAIDAALLSTKSKDETPPSIALEAQPAAAGDTRRKVEAVTRFQPTGSNRALPRMGVYRVPRLRK